MLMPKAKSSKLEKEPEAYTEEDLAAAKGNWEPLKAAYTCRFKGYEIIAWNNIVSWHTVGEPGYIDTMQMERHLNGIELKTDDVCQGLFNSQDHVIWWGKRQVWTIEYVGGDQVFKFAFLGNAVHSGKRIGYQNVTLDSYMIEDLSPRD